VDLGVAGVERQCLPVAALRLLQSAQAAQHVGEVVVAFGVAALQRQNLAEALFRSARRPWARNAWPRLLCASR
jgi:hypothetical protein